MLIFLGIPDARQTFVVSNIVVQNTCKIKFVSVLNYFCIIFVMSSSSYYTQGSSTRGGCIKTTGFMRRNLIVSKRAYLVKKCKLIRGKCHGMFQTQGPQPLHTASVGGKTKQNKTPKLRMGYYWLLDISSTVNPQRSHPHGRYCRLPYIRAHRFLLCLAWPLSEKWVKINSPSCKRLRSTVRVVLAVAETQKWILGGWGTVRNICTTKREPIVHFRWTSDSSRSDDETNLLFNHLKARSTVKQSFHFNIIAMKCIRDTELSLK